MTLRERLEELVVASVVVAGIAVMTWHLFPELW